MLKAASTEYFDFLTEMMVKENFPIDNFTFEVYLAKSIRTQAHAGFVVSIETLEEDIIAKTPMLTGDPYSFGNRHAVKRAIKAAKKIVC